VNGIPAKTATMVTDTPDDIDISDTVWLTYEDIPTSPKLLTIMPGAVGDLTEFPSALKEIIPVDKLGPRLTVSTDTAITNGLLTIVVTTVETLTAAPTVTINGVTFGSAQPIETNVWAILVDGTTFTGSAAGDGVKNVEAAAFDAALNIARGGVQVGSVGYPTGAIQFHLDTVIKDPIVVPGDREVSIVSRPLLTVSFADEIGEYSGDTHPGVTIVNATLDGQDVTSGFTAESASTWSYRPSDLTNATHTLEVVGRDDAGNTHSPIVRVFSVDAPAPTATPVPTETPTPLPTIDALPTVEGVPTDVPADSGDVATAVPENVPPQPDSAATSTPEPAATAVPVPSPDSTPEPENTEPDPSETPVDDSVDPELVPTPSDPADPEATPTESTSAEDGESSEAPAEDAASEDRPDEADLTDDDLAATVAAMRADDDLDADDTGVDTSIAPGPALTVFGCNVPTGAEEAAGAVVAGADYLLMAAGLFGLIVARARPKNRKRRKSNGTPASST
ncbi:MAG: hypothetical protein V3T49_01085, partial [Dehalococcoidia bacterium]